MKPLIEPRYGHSQIYNNGAVYIIGGFDHEDIVGLPPSTLTTCEMYVPPEEQVGSSQVASIAQLNLPRAYAGCCQLGGMIYVFGGLNGYETLSSIEQYNTGADVKSTTMGVNSWVMMYTKMPLKLAKVAAAAVDKGSIMIVGGIYGSASEDGYSDVGYQYVNSAYKLELSQTQQPKWSKQPKMLAKRTHYSTLPVFPGPGQGQATFYALGGSADGSCEMITFPSTNTQSSYAAAPKWKYIKSYLHEDFAKANKLELNDLQTFCLSN